MPPALRSGYCEVKATSGGGVLYRQIFPYAVNGFVRAPPASLKSSPYSAPFGLTASYAPLSKVILIKIDRGYMERKPESGSARLVDPATGRTVAERKIAPFNLDYSEFTVDVSGLPVPIETEADWLAAPGKRKAVRYRVEAVLAGPDGAEIARSSAPVALSGYQFEWAPNSIGVSDKVIPPWEPLKWEKGVVSMWNKSYRLNGLGLADEVLNGGKPQLSGAMEMIATINGQDVKIAPGEATLKRLTEAEADFEGSAFRREIGIKVATRVEFDGFVFNTMTIDLKAGCGVDGLSLVVKMPKTEAPCFVTTGGGWASYYGWTPAHWDSTETASTSRVGNFVPYLFLTDSERGFCWFADNDAGWIIDPQKPAQQISSDEKYTTLRARFISRKPESARSTTIRYGWMATPQKPQPHGWRGYHIDAGNALPNETAVFWCEADWAVLWPYYSSPYPWSYEKSASAMAPYFQRRVVPCVGNIAHSIGRYRDYKGRVFEDLAADWGMEPGDRGDGNVARSKGPNDFQLWHFDRWIKKSGLSGLYFDENYLAQDDNYLTGQAYLLPDGTVQPGYSYLGLREFNKRLRYLFHARGKPLPNLWEHTTGGQAVYSWMPDVSMEGENVEPSGTSDYVDALPPSRLRSIGMGASLGSAPFIMCQTQRHSANSPEAPFLTRQFLGWVLLHDCLPEGVAAWPPLSASLELWRDDIRFLPYWKQGLGVESRAPGVLVSAHARPGHVVLWVFNTTHQDTKAVVDIDVAQLGLARGKMSCADVESQRQIPVARNAITVNVGSRNWRAIQLVAK